MFKTTRIYNDLSGHGELLMTRTELLRTPWGVLHVHVFHASDAARDLHDHPWRFISLILWGGYTEVRPVRNIRVMVLDPKYADQFRPSRAEVQEQVWIQPGTLRRLPARWAHRVVIAEGAKAFTLIWTFPHERSWGFYTESGWMHNRRYHEKDRAYTSVMRDLTSIAGDRG